MIGLMNPVHAIPCLAARWWLPVLVLLAVTMATVLRGQDNVTPAGGFPPGQILIREDDGKMVSLEEMGFPPEKVDQILEWLTMQLSVRTYEIANIEATGSVRGAVAELQVKFRIEILTDNDWVRVPIGFESWTLTNFQHESAGSDFEAWSPGNTANTREWHLKGKGSHILTLDLIAEVRDQEANRHRLKMSLPKHLMSKLELAFDETVEGVRGNNGIQPVYVPSNQPSTMTFFGLKPETEISWQSLTPAGDQEATVISTPQQALMDLDLTSSTATLTCRQSVNIAGGAIERLAVRLPPGYRQIEITGRDENGNLIVQPNQVSVADDGVTANVTLVTPVRGRVNFQFNLQLKDTGFPQKISVSVPDIDGVPQQSGIVNIRIPRGLDVDIPEAPFTRRTRINAQSDQRSEEMAFELLSTEASLQLDVREVEALFAVEPQLEFTSDDDGLLLLARFPVNVNPGSLAELQVEWDGYLEDGWQIIPDSIYLTEDGGKRRKLSRSEPGNDAILLSLESFQSGRFSVEFRAFRGLNNGTDSDDGVTFTLPDIEASTVHPTIVSLVESDVYSLSMADANNDSPFSIMPPGQMPGNEKLERATTWSVGTPRTSVRIRRTLQTQEVNSVATVALDVRFDSVHVRTEIDIDVRHRDLRELRFTAPDGVIPPSLQLSTLEDDLVPSEISGDEIVWQLPEAIRGKHTATIDYVWAPESSGADNRLPLVLPSRGLSSLTIGTDIPDVLSVVEDDSLHRRFSRRFRAAWSTDEFRRDVALHIPVALQLHQAHEPAICLVESDIDPFNVRTTTTAIYETKPRSVLFRVPADVGVFSMVNGKSVEPTFIEIEDNDTGQEFDSGKLYQVSVPAEIRSGSVRVSLTCITPRGPHHHLVSTAVATYPRVVDAPEWLTIVWMIGTDDGARVVSLNSDEQAAVSHLMANTFLYRSADALSRTVATALTGFPESVRSRFQEQLDSSVIIQRTSLAFVARPEFQTIPVIIYSRAMGWAAAAVLAVVFYALLSFFHQRLSLVSLALIPASVAVWAVFPQQTATLLFPLIPAVIAATTAWMFRQLVIPARSSGRPHRRSKSIFASAPRTPLPLSVSDPLAPSPSGVEAGIR